MLSFLMFAANSSHSLYHERTRRARQALTSQSAFVSELCVLCVSVFSSLSLPFDFKLSTVNLPSPISFRIRTSEKCACNSFRMCTSKTQDLKPFRMNTSKKRREGGLPTAALLATHHPRLTAFLTCTYIRPTIQKVSSSPGFDR